MAEPEPLLTTLDEAGCVVAWFAGQGVELFQGNYFAEPGFERLPDVPAERLNVG